MDKKSVVFGFILAIVAFGFIALASAEDWNLGNPVTVQNQNITGRQNLTFLPEGAIVIIGAGGNVTSDAANLTYYPANQTLVVKLIKTQNISDSDSSSYYIDPANTGASAAFAGKIISGTTTTSRTPQLFLVSGEINSFLSTDGVVEIQAASNRPDITGTGTLVVESNSAMAVDTGASISFGGRTTASSTQGDIFGAVFGGKQSGVDAERNGYLAFFLNSAGSYVERLRIASSGNVGSGTSSFPSGGGTPVFVMGQISPDTHPSGMGSNTVGIYGKDVSGTTELFTIDEGGTYTQQTSHPSDFLNTLPNDVNHTFPWVYTAGNGYLGKKITVDSEAAFRALEVLTGKQFVWVENINKISWADTENYREQEENNKSRDAAVQAWLRNASELEVLPSLAFEWVWDNKTVTTGRIVGNTTEYSYDENGTVIASIVPVFETKTISRQKKQLKDGIQFNKAIGKFYRKPTRAEAEAAIGGNYTKYTKQAPPLWMQQRGVNWSASP